MLREFFGTLPGLITAIAALITAIATAFLGGTQLTARPAPAVTVTATDTITAPAAPATPADVATSSTSTQPSSAVSSPATASRAADGTDLATLTPVQESTSVDHLAMNQPQQIGTTTYSDGIRFSCSSTLDAFFGYNSLVFIVAGYRTLTATLGVPDDAGNGAGNSAAITFYKDGAPTRIGAPITVRLDSPQQVRLDLVGVSQLEISCTAAEQYGSEGDDIDVAIVGATLSK